METPSTGHETKNAGPTVAGCGVRPHHLGTRILRQSPETCCAGTAKCQVWSVYPVGKRNLPWKPITHGPMLRVPRPHTCTSMVIYWGFSDGILGDQKTHKYPRAIGLFCRDFPFSGVCWGRGTSLPIPMGLVMIYIQGGPF